MNITELIKRQREYVGGELGNATADVLLAQQVCIEQMREALDKVTSAFLDTSGNHTVAEAEAIDIANEALVLQSDLFALREHDADVIRNFVQVYCIKFIAMRRWEKRHLNTLKNATSSASGKESEDDNSS